MGSRRFLVRLAAVAQAVFCAAVGVAILIKIYKTSGQIHTFSETWPSGVFFLIALYLFYSALAYLWRSVTG